MIPQKSEGMSFLELQNISKSYKYVNVLQDVSFSIQKGDIFGYVGPNGAGKTTTIKILVGLIQNFQGKILIKGIDISKNRQLLHKVLGYLPQETSFQEWRTVETALNTFGLLSGISKKELESRIDEVLKIVGLPDSRKRKINHLSGGMKQKLQFAQALLHDPEFIVLDEPMSGLDPTSRYQVRKIIKNLAKNGKTIFLSSHILSDIQDICTRIGILNNGNILKIGTPQELQDEFDINSRIEIKVVNNSKLFSGLESIQGVAKVSQTSDNTQEIQIDPHIDIDKCMNEILRSISEKDGRIQHIKLLKPSLEDVYLHYIGGEI